MTRLLFICGKARQRSPTAADLAQSWGYETDFAGLSRDADEPLTPEHLDWADMIFVMERAQKKRLTRIAPVPAGKRVICLDIPDRFAYMDDSLVTMLQNKLSHHITVA